MKNSFYKEEKGITLIALVITIIVLLILAGVSISMLSGENGILNRAAEAKEETGTAQEKEEETLNSYEEMINGYVDGTTGSGGNDGDDETPEDPPVETTIASLKESGEAVGEKTTLTDETGDQIVIPEGFKIKADSPTEVDKGIVVVAPDASEFVWVPVADASKMYGTNSSGVKLGKLYDFTSDGYSANNWTETDGVMSWTDSTSYREPAYLTDSTYADASSYNTVGITESSLQNEYKEMIEKVEKSKGFYVGRYETSINANGNAQSKSGETSANASNTDTYRWYGFYQKEKEYSEKNSITEVVGSSMIWGSQWDQMMIWMQTNGIDVTSTTPTNLEGVTTSRNEGETTGTVESDKLNNIYDLLGNRFEWTLEANTTNGRISRGGGYSGSHSPSYRYNYNPRGASAIDGSRLALYVK